MAGSLYNSRAWRRRSRHQLTIEPLCRYCLTQERTTPATVADHIEPHRGDPERFWHGELQSLCESCHNGIKQQLERTGKLRGCDASGVPLDPTHPWREAATGEG